MAKSEAEIREEIRREYEADRKEAQRREDEAAEKRRKADESRSLWEMIKDGLSFVFGNWFGILVTGIIAYALATTEWGKDLLKQGAELLEKGINMLPESWQLTAHGLLDKIGVNTDRSPALLALADKNMPELRKLMVEKGTPQEVVDIIAKDKTTLALFLKEVRDANREPGSTVDGKANPSTFTNDKTLFQLMKNQPKMVLDLAAATLKPGATQNSDTSKQVTAALAAIVGDERLDVLLSRDHFTNTRTLIRSLAPSKVTDAQLDTILQSRLDATGKITPEFRAFFSNALTRDGNGNLQFEAALDKYADKNVQIQQMINRAVVAPAAPAAPGAAPAPTGEPQWLIDTKKVPQNAAALQTLYDKLGDAKFTELRKLASGENPIATMKFAIENRASIDAFIKAADVAKLPSTLRIPVQEFAKVKPTTDPLLMAILNNNVDPRNIEKIFREPGTSGTTIDTRYVVGQLLDPANRATLAQAGSENVVNLIKAVEKKAPADLTGAVLDDLLVAAKTIGENPKAADAAIRDNTIVVTAALAERLLNKNPDGIKKLMPAQYAEFSKDPVNRAALKALLKSQGSAEAQVLLNHWGVVEALSQDVKYGVPLILSKFADVSPIEVESCKKAPDSGFKLGDVKDWFKTWEGLGEDTIVGKYKKDLKDMQNELDTAQCAALGITRPAAVPAR